MSRTAVNLTDAAFEKSLAQLRTDDRFINAVTLMGKTCAVEIVKVTIATLRGREIPCAVLKDDKGNEWKRRWLITAKCVQNELARRSGTNKPNEWAGLRLTIYSDPDVRFGKEKVGGIRICPLS